MICGTLFHIKRYVYENGHSTSCSKKCSAIVKSRANPKFAKVEKECEFCKKNFFIKPSRADKSKFCSAECRIKGSSLLFKNPEILEMYRKLLNEGKTLEEIGQIVGKSSTTVCQTMNDHSIGHPHNRGSRSAQEAVILKLIEEVLNEKLCPAAQYPGYAYIYDAKSSIGYIEYDGRGGHYRPDQIQRDKKKDQMTLDMPIIRISTQAFYGEKDYLNWFLKKENVGYVAAKIDEYTVTLLKDGDYQKARQLLRDCHPLECGSGKIIFGLKFNDQLIGASQLGNPVYKNETGLELRRFFILDGTPKNTESWFLKKCMNVLPVLGHKKLITYCHDWEKASYLTALGWKEIERPKMEYDYYLWNGKVFSKRVWWKWAKEAGLVDAVGTKAAKLQLAKIVGAEVIYEGTKRKFIFNL